MLLLEVVQLPAYSLYENGAARAAFEPDKELAASEKYLAEVGARLPATGSQVRTRVELAQPAVSIAQIAADENVDLVAMATPRRRGFVRLVLGSVVTGTLRRTKVPLMLFAPAALHVAAAPAEAHAADSKRGGLMRPTACRTHSTCERAAPRRCQSAPRCHIEPPLGRADTTPQGVVRSIVSPHADARRNLWRSHHG